MSSHKKKRVTVVRILPTVEVRATCCWRWRAVGAVVPGVGGQDRLESEEDEKW